MLEGIDETVEFVQSQDDPLLTSSICVYEVLDGALGSGTTDVATERQRFGGVRAIESPILWLSRRDNYRIS
jgi:hypothetical protein